MKLPKIMRPEIDIEYIGIKGVFAALYAVCRVGIKKARINYQIATFTAQNCKNVCEPKYKAEIERLQQNLKEAHIDIKEYQNYINQRLSDAVAELLAGYDIETVKADAIRKFAEIIENNDVTGGGYHLEVDRSVWDKTKKEMVGDTE